MSEKTISKWKGAGMTALIAIAALLFYRNLVNPRVPARFQL